jgi:hypothetical protein
MPYQIRHADETLVPSRDLTFTRCSLEGLELLKNRSFGRNTLAFRGIVGAAVVLDAVAAILDKPVAVFGIALVLAVVATVAVARVHADRLVRLANTVSPHKGEAQSHQTVRPFVNYG